MFDGITAAHCGARLISCVSPEMDIDNFRVAPAESHSPKRKDFHFGSLSVTWDVYAVSLTAENVSSDNTFLTTTASVCVSMNTFWDSTKKRCMCISTINHTVVWTSLYVNVGGSYINLTKTIYTTRAIVRKHGCKISDPTSSNGRAFDTIPKVEGSSPPGSRYLLSHSKY